MTDGLGFYMTSHNVLKADICVRSFLGRLHLAFLLFCVIIRVGKKDMEC